MPQNELAVFDLAGEQVAQKRLNRVIGILAVFFVLIGLAFAGFYAYTKYTQIQLTPEQKAINQAIQQIRDNPRSSAARVKLGILYTQAGMTDEAIDQFDQALKIARDDEGALLYAGIAYMTKGQNDKALTYFDKEIKYYKNTALAGTNMNLEQAYYYSAIIYWRKKDYDKTLENAAAALKIKATSADTHLLIGRVHLEKKSYDEAIAALAQALKFDPAYPDALYGTGLAYEAKGDTIKALENYKAALKAKPGFTQAEDAVRRLEPAAAKT